MNKYSRFRNHFNVAALPQGGGGSESFPADLKEFFEEFGGVVVKGGLYNVILGGESEVDRWRLRIESIFPEFLGRSIPFAWDWLGRVYCMDLRRTGPAGASLLLIFSALTDEVLEVPDSIEGFHNGYLVDMEDGILESSKFIHFLSEGNLVCLPSGQCVEMKVPLYLGGVFDSSNMALVDLESFWGVSAVLLSQFRGLEVGQQIGGVSIKNGVS